MTFLKSNHRFQSKLITQLSYSNKTFIPVALLMVAGGTGLSAQSASAQINPPGPVMQYNPQTGVVEVDSNTFNIRTGDFENTSNIPLPTLLPETTREGVALPVDRSRLVPNDIEITVDEDYIRRALDDSLDDGRGEGTYILTPDSVELTTDFNLNYRVGSHDFGEGIEVIVNDGDGSEISRESAFVRGDSIERGPNGAQLPSSNSIRTTYDTDDTVRLRVLNLRQEGVAPSESGIYFSESGELIVEDLPNGGDLDFDDGEYVEIFGGRGEALATVREQEVETEEQVTETPLEPEIREEESSETEEVTSIIEMDAVTVEDIDWGEVELPETTATSVRLGHATAARTAAGELLVYDRYARAGQVRAGSDGLGLTGQLAPLVNNPNVPPTLLSGNLTFNPFVGDNEAAATATVGLTQFLTRTHRTARDIFGNEILTPDEGGRRLVEPAGLFNNRRWVGYVPPEPDETVLGSALSSVAGVFDLPGDSPVVVAAPDAQRVGRGNAAYTDNVGGLLVESASGELSFVPQWTGSGYAPDPLTLEAGEATRIIYALVPQQSGQNLQLGETYAVARDVDSYRIAEGGFTVISADRQPQNFVQETAEVYAVEDTLPNRANAVTAIFNGIPGSYAEVPGGQQVPTVDVTNAQEADARVGNTLFPLDTVAGDPGQAAYAQTTRAAGFYLGGSLTGGIGNQRNRVTEVSGDMIIEQDELRTLTTIDTFSTPIVQEDRVLVETTTRSQLSGRALFDIDEDGVLTNARFLEQSSEVLSTDSRELERDTMIRRGEESLIASRVEESSEAIGEPDILEFDQISSDSQTESEANFSPVQGELTLGGLFNFGNTPWTAAANTLRAEIFARDTVFGRSGSGSEVGWRAEALFHPFGEVRREAYQYDENGNAIAIYKTEPMLDSNGNQMMETIEDADGNSVLIAMNQFALDESGNRIAQTVGTGSPTGPGVYLRVQDAFDDDEGVVVAGGLELSF